ncbi:MAG TPA: 2-dehydropantoate 2-reductase [Stellaceae bacterium]|nr:2-dehydropantoate 2-reductase [Stellaceae bacterium]
MRESPSITVVGAGAIGGAIAFALDRAGYAPKLLARGATLAALNRDGLRVEGPLFAGVARVEASADPALFGVQDLVIGTLKAQDWPAALPSLNALVGPETVLLPVLNGVPWWYFDGVSGPLGGMAVDTVDPEGALMAALPARRVVGSVVYMGVTRLAPAVIDWSGGNRVILGEAAGPPQERTERVAEMLRTAGFRAGVSDDIRGEIWAKLLGNAACNPLSVIARARMDEIMGEAGLNAVALAAMHEVAAVAAAVGAPSPMSVEERHRMNAELGRFRTSMLQDFEAGRALELGALVDAVTEIGARLAVPTPMTAALGALARRAAALREGV